MSFTGVNITGNIITSQGAACISLEYASGTVTNNVLNWSGGGTAYNNTPVYSIVSNSHDLTFDGNTGEVRIAAGSNNLTLTNHNGIFTLSKSLSNADLATISMPDLVVTGAQSYTLNATTTELRFVGTGDFTGIGNSLANLISGGKGNDILVGYGGADLLEGGAGADRLTGGAGNDIFILRSGEADGDIITDFNGASGSVAGDVLNLSGWGAGTTITKGAAANAWIITDGVNQHVETVSIAGNFHVTGVVFG